MNQSESLKKKYWQRFCSKCKKNTYETLKSLPAVIVIVVVIRSFIFEPFHIPSGSMKPNLLVGDYIIVAKYTYGFSRHSFPFSLVPVKGRFWSGDRKPQRGDIVVFRYPQNPRINYIKRVIGLPGDNIQVKNGLLFINNELIPRKYVGSFLDEEGFSNVLSKYRETLQANKSYIILDDYMNSPGDNTAIFNVPEGYYFFMGDNRDHSLDSRFADELGFVPEENLVGKAKIIFFSVNNSFWKFWRWYGNIRWERMFKRIE